MESFEKRPRVGPHRVLAQHKKEILCVMTMQEQERHVIDDVDIDVDLMVGPTIRNITGAPAFGELEPSWSDEKKNLFYFFGM